MATARTPIGRFVHEHPRRAAAIGFGASLLLAGGAAAGSMHVLSGLDTELIAATRIEDVVDVPMANRILGAGEVVTKDDLTVRPLGASFVPDGAARTVAELLGRTVRERLLPDEVVQLRRLTGQDTEPGLSALLEPGQRALALKLADAGRVAGFVEPGDVVDLVVTFDDDEGHPAETVTVIHGSRVLAVDEKISETVDGTKVTEPQVTLALNAEDAERATHAARIGHARLTLHAVSDWTTLTADVPNSPVGHIGTRALTMIEWRETVSLEDLAAMEATLEQLRAPPPTGVDSHLLRPVGK